MGQRVIADMKYAIDDSKFQIITFVIDLSFESFICDNIVETDLIVSEVSLILSPMDMWDANSHRNVDEWVTGDHQVTSI